MTRVSSFGQRQALLSSLLQNQQQVFTSQERLNSGKKSRDFRGLASEATTLLNSRAFKSRVDTFQRNIVTVQGKVDANDVQLNGILNTARDFSQTIVEVLAQGEAPAFEEVMSEAFSFITDSLNTEVGGVFIFGGSKTDTPPVNATGIADLVAAGAATDLFENDQRAQKVRISGTVEMTYSLLADDVAKELFGVIKTIADYHYGGSGPIDGKLSAADVTFLTTELGKMDTALDVTQSVQTSNGLKHQRLETIKNQHGDTSDFLEGFISDSEDTNIAEAISRLNQDQLALEASLQTMARLSRLSLLEYI